jgi:hypothetical protein
MKGMSEEKIMRIKEEVALMIMCESKFIVKYEFTYFFETSLFMFV